MWNHNHTGSRWGEFFLQIDKLLHPAKKHIFPRLPFRKAAIKKELGDVLWYVAALCTELGLEMHEVADENLAKLAKRQEESKLHGDGDDRRDGGE